MFARDLYSDRSHYARRYRVELSDILRPYWKDAPFSDEQRRQMYGLSAEDFQMVDKVSGADLAVLPMTWNHYLHRGLLSQASRFIEHARQCGRPVLSYVSGDEGVAVPPEFDDVWVVRPSGFRSRRRKRQLAQPVFFEDPLKKYPELADLELSGQRSVVSSPAAAPQPSTFNPQPRQPSRQSSVVSRPSAPQLSGFIPHPSQLSGPWSCGPVVPSIGFCGQASLNPSKLVIDLIRGAYRNTAYHLGLKLEEPQPLYPPALLRGRALRLLANSPLVETRFVLRPRYRAGATGTAARERTTREFYENIAETDYTLCVRGGGNFSKRFYETLAMGRIPLLVDTDCLLPFEPELDWSQYIVRVPQEQLPSLPQAVAAHFTIPGQTGLQELKRACRRLWEEDLSFGGFHRYLVRRILAGTNVEVRV